MKDVGFIKISLGNEKVIYYYIVDKMNDKGGLNYGEENRFTHSYELF